MSGAVGRATGITAGTTSRYWRHLALKQALLGLAGAVGMVAAASYGGHYWQVGRFQVETDDAYVQADSIIIAPRVAGYIAEVLVNDNQPVKAGQVLARIDERDLRTALDQAIADREAAAHKVSNLGAQLRLQHSLIEEAQAQLASAQAAATFAAQDQRRYSDLARTGAGSVQQAQQTQSLLLQRAADTQRAQATLTSAQQQVDVSHCGGRGAGRTGTRPGGRAAGAVEPGLCRYCRPGRRNCRRAHPQGGSICAGRHAVDGRRAAACRLCGRQLQGDAAH